MATTLAFSTPTALSPCEYMPGELLINPKNTRKEKKMILLMIPDASGSKTLVIFMDSGFTD